MVSALEICSLMSLLLVLSLSYSLYPFSPGSRAEGIRGCTEKRGAGQGEASQECSRKSSSKEQNKIGKTDSRRRARRRERKRRKNHKHSVVFSHPGEERARKLSHGLMIPGEQMSRSRGQKGSGEVLVIRTYQSALARQCA